MNPTRFLKYVWPFFKIMNEKVKWQINIQLKGTVTSSQICSVKARHTIEKPNLKGWVTAKIIKHKSKIFRDMVQTSTTSLRHVVILVVRKQHALETRLFKHVSGAFIFWKF